MVTSPPALLVLQLAAAVLSGERTVELEEQVRPSSESLPQICRRPLPHTHLFPGLGAF